MKIKKVEVTLILNIIQLISIILLLISVGKRNQVTLELNKKLIILDDLIRNRVF
jgi:hypothetical protein